MKHRPDFKDISSYDEFQKYYWYREELKQICKNIGIDYSGGKLELNEAIEKYFKGVLVEKNKHVTKIKKTTDILTLDTKLLECGFVFNQKFKNFFKEQTGVKNFKFNADMAASAKKVKQENDTSFTLKDMLDIYYGKKEYAEYDNSSCQWNQFYKDFCADENSYIFNKKLKVASILWKIVRESTNEKIYRKNLIKENYDKLKEYKK
ncbi:MAG: SAP domain-containing protein [Methanobacteriaceae archaeon]|jgi:hypothetical protein|nr:SAP domain-containing protein [Candidatus Methanorudis spinitermitis]